MLHPLPDVPHRVNRAALLVLLASTTVALARDTQRASVGSDVREADGWSNHASISANGRFVAWDSTATNVVANDTNDADDVFVRDLKSGTTTRIGASGPAPEWSDHSDHPSLSANGRFVAFTSASDNLDDGDTNSASDIFVHDRKRGSTRRVSVSDSGGAPAGDSVDPAISANGRRIVFTSDALDLVAEADTNGVADVFVYDRRKKTTARVSVGSGTREGNGHCGTARISANGRFVAFDSRASNLVAEGGGGTRRKVFVRDLRRSVTTYVSVDSADVPANGDAFDAVISGNGRRVAFVGPATNLVPDDTNDAYDVFVHDRR